MASAVAPPQPSMFAVFKKRDFTLLWFSQLISTSGSALTDLAAGILIYRATGSALAVGLMLAATALPALVVGLVAGVFVDRYDRKKIMIVSCLLRAVLVASIPAIVAININLLYVVVFINAAHRPVLRSGAGERHPRRRDRRGAGGSQLLPVDQQLRLDGDRLRGRRPARVARVDRDRLLRRRADVPRLRRAHPVRHRAPDRPGGGHQRPRRDRRPARRLPVPRRRRRSCATASSAACRPTSRSACGTSCCCRSRSRS